MFLKKEVFTFNGQSLDIYELSALQRIEILEWLAGQEKLQEKSAAGKTEENKAAHLLGFNIRASARIAAMSLWHGTDKSKTVDQLHQEILETWPVEAVGKADIQVKILSGMIRTGTEEENAGDTEREEGTEETLEKP